MSSEDTSWDAEIEGLNGSSNGTGMLLTCHYHLISGFVVYSN